MLYPLLFENNFNTLIWGGNRLKPMKNLPADEETIGESWEISAVEGRESIVKNGILKGRTLSDLVVQYGEKLVGKMVYEMYGDKFPLLVKLIDAAKDLSIQVHPDDAMAKEMHNSFGKTEMWYVMDAAPGAKIYSGFKDVISTYEYNKRIEDGSICDVLKEHVAHEGDVFFIPAGRIHAICGGTMVAEIQQSSDITYRIFDYNRLGLDGKPRQLHTDLAAKALDYHVEDDYRSHYTRKQNKPVCLTDTPFFMVKLLEVNRAFHRKLYKYDSFIIYTCLKGNCTITLRSWKNEEKHDEPCIKEITLEKGNSCLIPACVADFNITPTEGDELKLLEVYIDNKNYNKDL